MDAIRPFSIHSRGSLGASLARNFLWVGIITLAAGVNAAGEVSITAVPNSGILYVGRPLISENWVLFESAENLEGDDGVLDTFFLNGFNFETEEIIKLRILFELVVYKSSVFFTASEREVREDLNGDVPMIKTLSLFCDTPKNLLLSTIHSQLYPSSSNV